MSPLILPLGLLARWEQSRRVVVVPMDEVQFVSFEETPAIGTKGLAGCSVVVVSSKYGAILAHIPPLPTEDEEDAAGHKNAQSMMSQVKSLHDHYKSLDYFPEAKISIICAWYEGAIAMPDHLQIMQHFFRELGYTPSVHFYDVYDVPVNPSLPGAGTVIVIPNGSDGDPVIYVEDRATL